MAIRAITEKQQTVTPEDADEDSLLDGLFSRYSISPKRLGDPGPSDTEIRQIVSAALTAPDHCALKPWRFIHIPKSEMQALGDVFAGIKARRDPMAGPEAIQRERDRAAATPGLIAIVARLRTSHPRVPVYEQYVSIGAAIQNMLLSVHGLGYGAKMVSGLKLQDPAMVEALNVGPWERLIGFLCIGTQCGPQKRRKRPNVTDHLTTWKA